MSQDGDEAVIRDLIRRYIDGPVWWLEVVLLFAAQLNERQRASFLRELYPQTLSIDDASYRSRLGLAARALLEWNTPSTSFEYRRTIRSLVDLHPEAIAAKLTTSAPLMLLGDTHPIVEYLARTVSDDDWLPTTPRPLSRLELTSLGEALVERFLGWGFGQQRTDRVAGLELRRIDLVHKVMRAYSTGTAGRRIHAFEAMMTALFFHEEGGMRIEQLVKLIEEDTIRSAGSRSNNASRRIVDPDERAAERVLQISRFVQIGVRLFIAAMLFSLSTLYRLIARLQSLARRRSADGRVTEPMTYRDRYPRLYGYIDAVPGEWLPSTLGFLCATRPTMLSSIVRHPHHDLQDLVRAAITATSSATSEVADVLIQDLHNADLNEATRRLIFGWLVRTRIIDIVPVPPRR
jgi:hypothetical protein